MQDPPIPFSQTQNPLMATLHFLSSVIDPRVAAEAAKGALASISHSDEEREKERRRAEAGEAAAAAGPAHNGEEVNGVASMEVDAASAPAPANGKGPAAAELPAGTEKFDASTLQAAAEAALSAAAIKARKRAESCEFQMRTEVAKLIETQLRKLEIKLRHFEELEYHLESERQVVEQEKKNLIRDRIEFQTKRLEAEKVSLWWRCVCVSVCVCVWCVCLCVGVDKRGRVRKMPP